MSTAIQLTPKVATSAHDTCGCKQATIFTDFDGVIHTMWYSSIDDMMQKTFDFLFESDFDLEDDDIWITQADGFKLLWCRLVAQYCFAKGRISKEAAYKEMIEDMITKQEESNAGKTTRKKAARSHRRQNGT